MYNNFRVGHQALAGQGEEGGDEKERWRERWLTAPPYLLLLHCKVSFVFVYVYVFVFVCDEVGLLGESD